MRISTAAVAIFFMACGGSTVTFNRDVAPILFEQCSGCHRPGQLASFSLLTYADARAQAGAIAEAVADRHMPPWLPDPAYGTFANERILTADQIETIQRWVEGGAPEGDPSDLPPAPVFAAGWQLGQPDLVLDLPETFTLDAGTGDVFRNFVIPVPIASRRYVRGVEFRPFDSAQGTATNAGVIHHAVMGLDRTRASRRLDAVDPESGYEGMFADTFENPDGFFVGWTPGKAAAFEGAELAWPLEPATDVVLQLHLLPSDKPVAVRPQIGFYFTDTPPNRSPMLVKLGTTTIDIPPGEQQHVVTDRFVLPVDVDVVSIYPHAHYVAREIEASARLADGSTRPLIRIRSWDFMWQDVYRLRTPQFLPRGSAIEMRFTYDNSTHNPRNPHHPPTRVVYGPRSSDEMGDLWLQVVTKTPADRALLAREQARHRAMLALQAAEHMVQTAPQDAGSRNFLGAEYLRAGRVDEAIDQLRGAVQLNPNHAEAHNNLGLAEQSKGRIPEAIGAFRRAVSLKPNDDSMHLNLANALSAAGRTAEAVEEWRRTLAINPDSADAHNNLGIALGSRKQIDEAIVHFERTLAINPGYAEAHNNLAIALGARGRFDEAIAHARRALELRPGYADAEANLKILQNLRR
jgi:Flp pilus assembly protein TadD